MIMLAVLLYRQADAATTGTSDGTYDFGSLSAVNDSAGAGYVTLGDKFKVGNGLFTAWTGIESGATTVIYGSGPDSNGVDPMTETTSPYTVVIKAEEGSTCKTFTFRDLGVSMIFDPVNSRRFTSFDMVFKDVNGIQIGSKISLGASGDISESAVDTISTLYSHAPWSVAGVASIEITYALRYYDSSLNSWPDMPADLNLETITIANVNAVSPPTVTGISPAGGPVSGGTAVTITGSNFSGATAVKFGTLDAAGYTVDSTTQIRATSPASSIETVDITVTTAGGTSTTGISDRFTYAKINQTIGTITFTPDRLEVNGTSTVNAIASSGLTVTFSSITPAICTVSGNTVTGIIPGTCTIAADQAGNTTYNAALQVTQDITIAIPLALSVSTLSDGSVTTNTTLNVSGMVTNPGNIRSLTVNTSAVQVNPDGSFSYPVQLLAGTNSITVVATDNADVTVTDTRTITMDCTAPDLTITYPPDNKSVAQNYITVTGTISNSSTNETTVNAVVTYTVNGSSPQTATVTDTTYTFTANLAPGMNTLQVNAVDSTGMRSQVKRTLSYNPAFSLAITGPDSDCRTVLNSYLLTGTVTDNSTPVTVTIDIDGQHYTPTVINDAYQQQLTFTDAKLYQISTTATDQSSNILKVQRNIIHTVPKAYLDTSGSVSIVDALVSMMISVGVVTPQPDQILRLDVAPMAYGVSIGDGKIDIEDTIIILRMAVGLL